MMSMGSTDQLVIPSEKAQKCVGENTESSNFDTSDTKWGKGQLEYEAEMRALDHKVY